MHFLLPAFALHIALALHIEARVRCTLPLYCTYEYSAAALMHISKAAPPGEMAEKGAQQPALQSVQQALPSSPSAAENPQVTGSTGTDNNAAVETLPQEEAQCQGVPLSAVKAELENEQEKQRQVEEVLQQFQDTQPDVEDGEAHFVEPVEPGEIRETSESTLKADAEGVAAVAVVEEAAQTIWTQHGTARWLRRLRLFQMQMHQQYQQAKRLIVGHGSWSHRSSPSLLPASKVAMATW